MHRKSIVGFLIAAFILAAGCSRSEDVTLHKPGVYKGPADPLIELQRNPKQQEALLTRFNQVQTDR